MVIRAFIPAASRVFTSVSAFVLMNFAYCSDISFPSMVIAPTFEGSSLTSSSSPFLATQVKSKRLSRVKTSTGVRSGDDPRSVTFPSSGWKDTRCNPRLKYTISTPLSPRSLIRQLITNSSSLPQPVITTPSSIITNRYMWRVIMI